MVRKVQGMLEFLFISIFKLIIVTENAFDFLQICFRLTLEVDESVQYSSIFDIFTGFLEVRNFFKKNI